MALTILLNGAHGRMGQAIASAAPQMGITVGAATDLGDDVAAAARSVDVLVDFSSPRRRRGCSRPRPPRESPS